MSVKRAVERLEGLLAPPAPLLKPLSREEKVKRLAAVLERGGPDAERLRQLIEDVKARRPEAFRSCRERD